MLQSQDLQSDRQHCPDFRAFCHVHDLNLVELKVPHKNCDFHMLSMEKEQTIGPENKGTELKNYLELHAWISALSSRFSPCFLLRVDIKA